MINALAEFLTHTKNCPPIKCVYIEYDNANYAYNDGRPCTDVVTLPVGYTEADYQVFLEELDFEYDDGYGAQELSGVIWYTDGTWSKRDEYDGSEWWLLCSCPDISNYFN